MQQVASIARKLALLQEGEYASQAQQISNIIAANTTKLILDRAKGVVTELTDISGAKDVMSDTVELITGKYQNDFIYSVVKKFDKDVQHLPPSIRTNWGAKMHLKDSLKDHLQDRPWLINQIIDEIPKEHLITAAQKMGTKGADLSAVLGYIPSSSNILDNFSPMSGVAAGDAYDSDDMPDLEETDDKGKRKEPELSYEDKGKEAEPKPVKLDNSPFMVLAGEKGIADNSGDFVSQYLKPSPDNSDLSDLPWYKNPLTSQPPFRIDLGDTGAGSVNADTTRKLYSASGNSFSSGFEWLGLRSAQAAGTSLINQGLYSEAGAAAASSVGEYGAIRALQLGAAAIEDIVPPIALYGGLLYGNQVATNNQKERSTQYESLASNLRESNPAEYYRLKNNIDPIDYSSAKLTLPREFDSSDPHEFSIIQHVAVGAAIARTQQIENNTAVKRATITEGRNIQDNSSDRSVVFIQNNTNHRPNLVGDYEINRQPDPFTSITNHSKDNRTEDNKISLPTPISIPAANVSSDGDNSGLCKASYPYDPDANMDKEDWMKDIKLQKKHKRYVNGKELYGLNPINVYKTGGVVRVSTELPGGEAGARECFKNLTGVNVPLVVVEKYFRVDKPDGTKIIFRPQDQSQSNQYKVEINAKNSKKIIEKITFK